MTPNCFNTEKESVTGDEGMSWCNPAVPVESVTKTANNVLVAYPSPDFVNLKREILEMVMQCAKKAILEVRSDGKNAWKFLHRDFFIEALQNELDKLK